MRVHNRSKPFWELDVQTFHATTCQGCTHAPDNVEYFCQIFCRGELAYCAWHMARHYKYSHGIRDDEMLEWLERSKEARHK